MAWRFWFRDGVGGCPGCMGWACRLAIASWLCFAATILLTSNVSMVCVSGAFLFVATALWLCHLGRICGEADGTSCRAGDCRTELLSPVLARGGMADGDAGRRNKPLQRADSLGRNQLVWRSRNRAGRLAGGILCPGPR
jgi:hypothetical protein